MNFLDLQQKKRMCKGFATLLLSFLIMLQQLPVYGWGQIGHRAIGQIAEWHLNKRAAKRIHQILDPNSLAMVSTWMDKIRSDHAYDYTYTWHWVTIPSGQKYDKSIQELDGDAYAIVQQIIEGLKSDTISAQQEEVYLKMLVHLVGDLHQPLHVGNGKDRGGNDIKVEWMGEPSNLHRVWDSDMINSKQLSYTELAQHLNRKATERLVQQWQAASLEQWLQEAMDLRPEVYDIPEDKQLGYDYAYANFPVVEKQLLLAGIHLAGILNEIYG